MEEEDVVETSIEDFIKGEASHYPEMPVAHNDGWIWLHDVTSVFPTKDEYEKFLRQYWGLYTLYAKRLQNVQDQS